MSPTIVLEVDSSTGERRPLLALGSPGGSTSQYSSSEHACDCCSLELTCCAASAFALTVIGTVFNVLTNVLDHGMNLFDAVAAPRVVARGGSTVLMEHQYVAGVRGQAVAWS